MKAIHRSILIATVTSSIALAAGNLLSQSNTSTSVTVDEFGIGLVNGTSIQSQLAGPLGLQYYLPYVVVPGTVIIRDSNPINGNQISDVIAFTNTFLFFASDGSDGLDAPADVLSFLPPDPNAPVVTIFEQGPEGNNFAVYTPGPGMPGYSAWNPSYTFLSDVIPEPGSGLVAGLGGGVLLLLRRRRQAKRH